MSDAPWWGGGEAEVILFIYIIVLLLMVFDCIVFDYSLFEPMRRVS